MFPNSTRVIDQTSRRTLRLQSLAIAVGLLFPLVTHAEIAAVASRTFNGYTRTRLPDKSFKPESYVFVNAGRWNAPIAGDSIDSVSFDKIIRTLVRPLSSRGYVPAKNVESADLIIFVAWGTTQGSRGLTLNTGYQSAAGEAMNQLSAAVGAAGARGSDGILSPEAAVAQAARNDVDSAMFMMAADNQLRDLINQRNAHVLGFKSDLQRAYDTSFSSAALDLFDELEANRYFVVLKAFDYAAAAKEKRRKVLWESRFSIHEQGNSFGDNLEAMAWNAARHFGEASRGLVRRKLPEGKVELGSPEMIRYEPAR